jgi:hypothetical protein
MADHRREYDRHLEPIDVKVAELFAVICEDLPAVTQALLSGSNEVAAQLADRDRAIDALYQEIEQLASREILLQAPVAADRCLPASGPALRLSGRRTAVHCPARTASTARSVRLGAAGAVHAPWHYGRGTVRDLAGLPSGQ